MRRSLLIVVALLWVLTVAVADEPAVIGPAEAARHVNEKVVVEMEVKSSHKKDVCFLNSELDHRKESNFTVFVSRPAVEKFRKANIEDPAAHFKGKTIRVTGIVTLHEAKPQIKIAEPDQIKIVSKN